VSREAADTIPGATDRGDSPTDLGVSSAGAHDSPAVARDGPTESLEVRQRTELEVRWRQARNAPPPVVRAVLANVAVATVGGLILVVVDWLASRGVLPGDLVGVAPVVYVATVVISGSLLTYLWVELPTGRAGERRRSGWSAVLGFFASIPIVYLALVIIFEVIRPLLP
jgi:hypothetical protein